MLAGPISVGQGRKVYLLMSVQISGIIDTRWALPEASGLASKGCIMSMTDLSPWRSSLFSARMRSLC
jgi:hypothetical protein